MMTFRLVENRPLDQTVQFLRMFSERLQQVDFAVVAKAGFEFAVTGKSDPVAARTELMAHRADQSDFPRITIDFIKRRSGLQGRFSCTMLCS